MPNANYNEDVFINCPLDTRYRNIFRAIIFAIFDCGFRARCVDEVMDTSANRLDSITEIIGECKYAIHDISRTGLDRTYKLPRFNMPFELGIFIGAKRFGDAKQKTKNCLVLDRQPYRYQRFISDLAGQDIADHNDKPEQAISVVRDWLRKASGTKQIIPGPKVMVQRYSQFAKDLPKICKLAKVQKNELIFNDYVLFVSDWIKNNP